MAYIKTMPNLSSSEVPVNNIGFIDEEFFPDGNEAGKSFPATGIAPDDPIKLYKSDTLVSTTASLVGKTIGLYLDADYMTVSSGGTIANITVDYGGRLVVSSGATIIQSNVFGIRASSGASLQISGAIINGCGISYSKMGGGLMLFTSADLLDNTFSNLTVQTGAALYISGGSVRVSGGIMSGNSAFGGGGAIDNDGTLVLSGGILTRNSASTNCGGAIFNNLNAHLTVSNCLFQSNTAKYGGAIYNKGSAAIISCSFSGNSATIDGAISNHATTGGGMLIADTDFLTASEIIYNQGIMTFSGTIRLGGNLDTTRTIAADGATIVLSLCNYTEKVNSRLFINDISAISNASYSIEANASQLAGTYMLAGYAKLLAGTDFTLSVAGMTPITITAGEDSILRGSNFYTLKVASDNTLLLTIDNITTGNVFLFKDRTVVFSNDKPLANKFIGTDYDANTALATSGGIIENCVVAAGGMAVAASGAQLSGLTVDENGSQYVYSGGSAIGTQLYCVQIINSGGYAKNTAIRGVAAQWVSAGGCAEYTAVSGYLAGGTAFLGDQYIESGASGRYTSTYAYGYAIVKSGGVLFDAETSGGGVSVRKGGVVSNVTVYDGRLLASGGGASLRGNIHLSGTLTALSAIDTSDAAITLAAGSGYIDNLSMLSSLSSFSVTVDSAVSGKYILAGGAAAFTGSMTVTNELGHSAQISLNVP
ncbi:MAG: hypothetical protein PHI85_07580 [Victivallaceae bacterium]|nr:hypothetical protein [Victivallaceae bacterium]